MGETFPTVLITQWCHTEWLYEDVSATVHMSCPRVLLFIRNAQEPSRMLATRLVRERIAISNFDAWCSMMMNTSLRIWATDTYCVITLLLNIGTVQGSTDIYIYIQNVYIYIYIFLTQTHLRYLYLLLSHHHSPTSSCDLAIMITPFSAQTLEQMHLSTRLHSSHPPAEICSV